MNISKTITLINDIKNLKFVEDPKLQPGEVDKPYFVNFSLETGDEPTFYVQFGNNISVFLLCDDVSVNKTMRANTRYVLQYIVLLPGRYSSIILTLR